MTSLAALIALFLDWRFGYPDALQNRIGHPVQWMGALIDRLDQCANWPDDAPARRRTSGAAVLVILLVASVVPAFLIADVLDAFPYGWIAEGLLAAPFFAQKSLSDAVAGVSAALETSLPDARQAVAHIVGRDTDTLDKSGVARAAIESLAENTSDGIVAPLFWFLLFGLPGIVAYKAINTADSMLGHRNTRFADFGWASARLDDLVNIIPSRLTALLFAAAALAMPKADPVGALSSALRDAPRHASPNAGWPEAAMAGALGITLGGARDYGGESLDLPKMGAGRTELTGEDIVWALILYRMAGLILTMLVAMHAFAVLSLA